MLFSYIIVPKVDSFGKYFGYLDRSGVINLHKKPIVRIGGIAIFLGFSLSLILIIIFLVDRLFLII